MGDMEKNRRQDQKYLKSLLYTRINQHKMLNDTLMEMISRNSSSKAIEMMKAELDGIVAEMENINKDLEKFKNNSEEPVIYSYYDKVAKDPSKSCFEEKLEKEEKKESGFYDSIVKQTKACQYKDNDLTNEFVEDFRNTADSRLQASRFLVDLKAPLNIPEIMVRSVSFDPNDKRVSVCIYDFVTEINGEKSPILEILKYAPTSFSFPIKHLEADGEIKYIEYYTGCRVYEIFRDPIDYASDDFSKIQIFITYQDVTYEASK